MEKLVYTKDNGLTWTTITAALPYTIPATQQEIVTVRPVGDTLTVLSQTEITIGPGEIILTSAPMEGLSFQIVTSSGNIEVINA